MGENAESWVQKLSITIDGTVHPPSWPSSLAVVDIMLSHREWFTEVDSVIDMCCGSGVLGITAARLSNACACVFVDVEPAAVSISLKNAARAGIIEAKGFVSDAWAQVPQLQADLVLCNPPFQPIGNGGHNLVDPDLALHNAFFRSARDYLADGGHLLVGSSPEISGTQEPELLPEKYGWTLAYREQITRAAPTAKHPERNHSYRVSLYS